MKTIFLFVAAWLVCSCPYSQNLIQNGSFETMNTNLGCPAPDGFDLGAPANWIGYIPNPSNGIQLDPDYYNPCATPGRNYPGTNQAGCAAPLDGSSYVGFLAVKVTDPVKGSEYLFQQIQMTGNQRYYVEFYVNNAAGNPNLGWDSDGYVRNIGMYFTQDPNKLDLNRIYGLHQLTPQVPATPPSSYYQEGWSKVSGYFTPNFSGTWWAVIGDFDPQMNTNTNPTADIEYKSTDYGYGASYYYLDAVTIIPADQTPPSYGPTISGNTYVCSTTPTTYNLLNAPFGSSVSWSVSPSDLFSGATSGTGSTATLQAIDGLNAKPTLTFNITSVCGDNTPVSKTIAIGTEEDSFEIYYTYVTCVNSRAYLYIDYTPQFISSIDEKYYAQDLSNPNNPFVLKEDDPYPEGGNGSDFPLGLANRQYLVQIVETFPCGATLTAEIQVTAPVCMGGGGGASIAVSPNPVSGSSSLNVQVTDSLATNTSSTLDQSYELSVSDRFARKVFSAKSDKITLEIPVNNWPPDIYYLRLIYKDAILQKQIVISK